MPKPVREIFDFATLVDNKQELIGNSVRRAFEFDAYSDQDTFEAVVLTTPIPQSPSQLSSLISGEISGSSRVTKFSYRARILGNNSPHLFLPNPCDSVYVQDPGSNEKLIAMHTLFISHEEYGIGTSLPRIGSKVQVKLSKNVNGYNLQTGEHLKVVTSPIIDRSTAIECTSLEKIINNGGASPLYGFYHGENSGVPENVDDLYRYWQLTYPDAANMLPPEGKCGGGVFEELGYPLMDCMKGTIGTYNNVTLHPIFFDKVKEVFENVKNQNFGEPINGGDNMRSARTQMGARMRNATLPDYDYETLLSRGTYDPPTAAIPTTAGTIGSRHMYGLAIDFQGILMSGGTKVAKLDNSVARQSKTYKYMLTLEVDGFKNYSVEPWHWSVDGF